MNEKIIKILNELLKQSQSTNGTNNFYEIESNKFEAIIVLVKEQLKDLQHQLEEKDKIIDEILNDSWYTDECPIELSDFTKNDEKKFNCENCQNDYKKCWLKYFENRILERGKNGK